MDSETYVRVRRGLGREEPISVGLSSAVGLDEAAVLPLDAPDP